MMERLAVNLQIREGEDPVIDAQLNDKCNDAYGLIYALSMFAGPMLGNLLFKWFNGASTCDYLGLFNIGVSVLYAVFHCGPFVFSENREFQKKLAALTAEDEDGSMIEKDVKSIKKQSTIYSRDSHQRNAKKSIARAVTSHYAMLDTYAEQRANKHAYQKSASIYFTKQNGREPATSYMARKSGRFGGAEGTNNLKVVSKGNQLNFD